MPQGVPVFARAGHRCPVDSFRLPTASSNDSHVSVAGKTSLADFFATSIFNLRELWHGNHEHAIERKRSLPSTPGARRLLWHSRDWENAIVTRPAAGRGDRQLNRDEFASSWKRDFERRAATELAQASLSGGRDLTPAEFTARWRSAAGLLPFLCAHQNHESNLH